MHCFAYGGSSDPCSLNNHNDVNDGLDKDPSLCLGDTFYLWDEPDTQGHDYTWAGEKWLLYSQRFAYELEHMKSRGTKVTSPLVRAVIVVLLSPTYKHSSMLADLLALIKAIPLTLT